ncbi:unnamed protein product [Arctogadus glacialis]
MARNSWRQISANVGLPVEDCSNMWKKLRDRFVRAKKIMKSRSGDGGGRRIPPIYILLSWLGPHIKHQMTSSNYERVILTLEACPVPSTSAPEASPVPSTHTHRSQSLRPPISMSSPPASVLPSSLSRKGNRKRLLDQIQQDDNSIETLVERERELRLNREEDDASRFGATVADVVRQMPPAAMNAAKRTIYTTAIAILMEALKNAESPM